jgi:phosphoserine phosphatase RsbU/P
LIWNEEMKIPLRVLMVEDSEWDAELILNLLRRGGYAPIHERVETESQMLKALQSKPWDLILADYNLPQFSAPAALRLLHNSGLDLPFIVVSGGIGEDTAVASMKAGAHDYLMKDNLARLIPAVDRELREAANRISKRKAKEALRQSEARYRLLWETATDAIVLLDKDNTIHFANPAVREIFGYKEEEVIGKNLQLLQPEWEAGQNKDGFRKFLATGVRPPNWRARETTGRRKDGTEFPVEVAFSDMEFEGNRWFVGFIRDVSERKKAEQELQQNQEQFRVAREIQQTLFPKVAPAVPGYDIAGASYPAEATGGDYFDYLPMLETRVGIVVGDVTGHGVGPALLMAEARAYLRILARNRQDVGEILTRANAVLSEDIGSERFVTMLLAQLDSSSRTLSYVNAGHPPGYILDPKGKVRRELTRTNIPLGIRPETRYTSSPPIALHPGEIVLLVSDGFEEAISPEGDFFGTERILGVIGKHRNKSPAQIVEALYHELRQFVQDQPQLDDLTVMVAKVQPLDIEPKK